MRIALISDVHANEVALRAVIGDIRALGVDQVVCLGDVATLGPSPGAVIQLLRDLECPCILGNHDAFILDEELIHDYTSAREVVDSVDWGRSQLDEDELDFFRGFLPSLELRLDAETNLLLYHGTPRSYTEDLLATTPAAEVDEMLDGQRATVLAGGHTHIQMLRQHRGMLLANVGSVGMPFKEYAAGEPPTLLAHAEYALVEANGAGVHVGLRRVTLSRNALRKAAEASDNPLRGRLLGQYG